MRNRFRNLSEQNQIAIVVALIALAGTVAAAVVSGSMGLLASAKPGDPAPTVRPQPTAPATTLSPPATPEPPTPSPSETPTPSPAETTAPPPDLTVQSVDIEASDYSKVGAGLYQLSGHRTLDFRFWWTTATNYGPIETGDKSCTVVATMRTVGTNKLVDSYRTASCTFSGWVGMAVPQGRQRVVVDVTLANGARGTGTFDITVIP